MSSPRRLVEAVEVTDSGVHVVRLMRIFDAASVTEFEKVLAYLVARGHFRLVVELANVEFVASAGWGALTAEFRRVRDNGGDIRLAGMNPEVLDVFFLLELDSFMNAYDTLDEALGSFEVDQPHARVQPVQPKPPLPSEPVPAREIAAAEAESFVSQQTATAAPDAKKEAKKKKKERAPKPAANDTAPDPAAAPEAVERRDRAVRSPVVLGMENAASLQTGTAAAVSSEPNRAASAIEDGPVAVEFEVDEANGAYEQAPELPLNKPVPSKKKPQTKGHRRKNKPAKPSPTRAAKAPADLEPPSVKLLERSHDETAPPLTLRAAKPGKDAAQFKEDRKSAAPGSFAAQQEPVHDDFEMQDIHDPWLIDEIDTLPEEFEMEEGDWQGRAALELEHNVSFEEETPPLEHTRPTYRNEPFRPPLHTERGKGTRRMALPAAKAGSDDLSARSKALGPAPVPKKAAAKKASARKKKHSSQKRALAAPPVVETTPVAFPAMEELPMTLPEEPSGQVAAAAHEIPTAPPQPLQKSATIIKVSSEDDYIALVRQIVKEHPHYGPTMIGKFFETRVDPPVKASRSTVYRWLRLAGLSTRDQRSGFAGTAETAASVATIAKDNVATEA